MADFEIRMLNDSEVGISALTERAQKDRRIAAGETLAFKSPGDARPQFLVAMTLVGLDLARQRNVSIEGQVGY